MELHTCQKLKTWQKAYELCQLKALLRQMPIQNFLNINFNTNKWTKSTFEVEVYLNLLITQSKFSGSGCSKLTLSLVNVLLKFQMLIYGIRQYFLLKQKSEKLLQASLIFLTKIFSVFGYKVVKHVTS